MVFEDNFKGSERAFLAFNDNYRAYRIYSECLEGNLKISEI